MDEPGAASNLGNVAKASAYQLAGGTARFGELAYTPTTEKSPGPSWTESAKKTWAGLSEFGKAMFDPAEWNPDTRTEATLGGLGAAAEGAGELAGHAFHELRRAPGTGGEQPVSDKSKRILQSLGPGDEASAWLAKHQQDAIQALSPEVQAAIQKHAVEHDEKGYHFGEGVKDPWWWTNGVINAAESMVPGVVASKMAAVTTYATEFPKLLAKAAARDAPQSVAVRYATREAQKRATQAAVIAGGLSEGVIGGGANAQQTEQTINQLDEKTMTNYAGYRDLRKQGLTHDAARAEVARDKAFAVGLSTAIVDGLSGAPLNARIAKWATDTGLNKVTSRARAAVEGGLGESLQEAGQGAAEQLIQNKVEQPITGKGTWEDVLDQAVQGAAFAAPGGVVMGGLSGGEKTIATEKKPADEALERAQTAYTASQQKVAETEARAADPAQKVVYADIEAARKEHQVATAALAQAALNTGRLDAKTQQSVAQALQEAKAAGVAVPNETVAQPVDVNRKSEKGGEKATGVAPKPLNADEQAHLKSLDAVANAESMDTDTLHKLVADKLVKLSAEGTPVLLPAGRRDRKALTDRIAVAAEEATAEKEPVAQTEPKPMAKVAAKKPLAAKKPRKPKVDVKGAIEVITGRPATEGELEQAETNARVGAVSSEGASNEAMKEAFKAAKIKITPNKRLRGRAKLIERRMTARVRDNFDTLATEYNATPGTDSGRVLNTDLARELSPEYRADRSQSAAVHEPSSAFIKEQYRRKLSQPTPKGKLPVVVFTAGGTGAGKSRGLAADPVAGKAEIIYDTNIPSFESGKQKIDQALAAGRKVVIRYTYRHPIEALTHGMLPRAERMGRTVPLAEHIRTHAGSADAIPKLAAHYKGNSNVVIHITDNSHGKGQSRTAGVDIIPQLEENKLHEEAATAIEQEHQAGRISDRTYEGVTGRKPNVGRGVQAIRERPNGVGPQVNEPAGRTERAGRNRSNSSVAPEEVSAAAIAALKANGGFTIDAQTGVAATTGFAFAPSKTSEQVIDGDATEADVQQYLMDNAKELAKPGRHVGGWKSGGKTYLDISHVAATQEEATAGATKSKQQAIFNLENGETINLGEKPVREAAASLSKKITGLTFSHTPGRSGSTHIFQAYKDGDLVGTMGVADGKIAHIDVESKYRRQGAASALLDYARKQIGNIEHDTSDMTPAGRAFAAADGKREAAPSLGKTKPAASYKKTYDRGAKSWTVQRLDAKGNQIGDAVSVYSKPEADAAIAGMKREDNTNVLKFKHFSRAESPELQLEPKRQGTGLKGEERKRGGEQVTSLYAENGDVEDDLKGLNQYNVEVPERDVYDANMDPLNLRAKARVPVSFTPGEDGTLVPGDERFDFNEYERLIKEAGYKGYHTPRAEGVLRGQARMFEPVTGKRAREAQASLAKGKLTPEQALRKVAGLLTENEKKSLHTATAQRLVDIFHELPSDKDLAAAAIAGQAKRGWYKRSAEAIANVFGPDAPRFAAALAALSPKTSVEQNFKNAVSVFVAWDKAGRPQDRRAIVQIMRNNLFPGQNRLGKVGVLPAWIDNTVRALTSDDPDTLTLSGPKVDSFAANLRGETNRVTLDAWMANFANVEQKIFAGGLNVAGDNPGMRPGYLAYTARVRQAAARLSALTGEVWTPAEVQETVWSWAKTLYEQADKFGALGTAKEILDDGVLTDDLINASPDFATLFTDPAQQKALRDAGYSAQLDQLAGEKGQPRPSRKTIAPLEGDSERLRRAAGRLDALKAKRVAAEKETREAAASIAKNRVKPGTGIGTAAFRKWFGKSKVVDSYGNPMTVYHASRADITAFDPNRGASNYVGKGIYFTDEVEDVDQNYAIRHLDAESKIEARAAELSEGHRDENGLIDVDEAYAQARREYFDAAPAIYAGYLSIQNPLRMHFTETESSNRMVYDKALNTQLDSQEVWRELQHWLPDDALNLFSEPFDEKLNDPDAVIYGEELRVEFFMNPGLMEELGGYEDSADVFQTVVKGLGFDGIAHTGAHFQADYGSTHYVAFNNTQFKSYYNSGTWSPDSANMAASTAEKEVIDTGGIHPDVARSAAKEVSDAIGVPVHVAGTQLDLPPEVNSFLADGLNVNGLFIKDPTSPNGGEMWIVAETTGSREEAVETAIHETVGHLGTRVLLGDRWNDTMDAIAKSFPAELQDIAADYKYAINHADPIIAMKSRRQAADELVAYAAGKVLSDRGIESEQGVWSKIIAYVRDVLRQIGFLSKYSTADLNALIYRSRDALKYSKRQNQPARIAYEARVAKAASLAPYLEQTKTPAFKRWFGKSKIVDKNGLPMRMYHATTTVVDFSEFDIDRSNDIGMHFGTAGQAFSRIHGRMKFGLFTNAEGELGDVDSADDYEMLESGRTKELAGARILPVYLSINNPLRMPDLNIWETNDILGTLEADNVLTQTDLDDTHWDDLAVDEQMPALRALLEQKGYDGIVYKNTAEITGMPELEDQLEELITRGHEVYRRDNPPGSPDQSVMSPEYDDIARKISAMRGKMIALRQKGQEDSYIVFRPGQIKSAVGNVGAFSSSNVDIAASLGKQVGATGNADLDSFLHKMGGEKPTLRQRWNDFRENLGDKIAQATFDQFHGIKRAATVAGISVGDSGYMDARLSSNSAELVQAMMEYGAPVWKDGAPDLTGGRGFLSILQPLGGKLNLWLAYQVATRASRLMGEGRENLFTPEEIKAGLDLGKQHPEFKVVSQEYSAFQKKVLDFAQEAGIINPDSRALWENQDYIPFYRMVENGEVSQNPSGGKGLGFVRNQIKQLKGGTEKIGDPLENITRNWLALMDASLKANAARTVVDAFDGTGLVVKDPAPFVQTILPKALFLKSLAQNPALAKSLAAAGVDPRKMSEAQIRGLQQMFVAPVPNEEGKISVWRNGRREHWTVHDTMLFSSLQGISAKAWGPIMEILRAPKRLLTATVTIVPQFAIKNVWRDMWHTFIIGTNDGKTITPIVDTVKGTIASMKMDQAAQSMLAGGASFSHGYIHGGNPAAGTAAVRRTLKAHHKGPGMLLDSPLKLFRFYRKLLNASENANRVAIYNKALARGKTRKEALYEARDILDFGMRGNNAAVRFLVESVPFFNARLQGLYRLGRGVTKATAASIFMRGALLAAMSLAILARNWKDDRYRELSDDQKSNYWHLFDVLEQGDHWKIPKPFETGVIFGTIPEVIGDAFLTNSDEPDAAAQAAEMVGYSFAQQLNMSPQPQAIWPMLELAINKNTYTGAPVLTQGDQGVLPEDQVGPSTSPTYRELARLMPDIAPEALRSPKQLEHLGRGYIGNVQDYVLLMTDKLVREARGEPATPKATSNDWPGLRDFRTTGPSRHTKYMDAMYDIADKAEEAYKSFNKALKAETDEGDARAEEIEQKYGDVLDIRKDFSKAVDQVSDLKKQQRQIQLDPDMSPEDKRAEMDDIQQEINDIAKDVYDLRPGGKLNPKVGAELLTAPPEKRAQILKQNGLPATAELLKQAGQ